MRSDVQGTIRVRLLRKPLLVAARPTNAKGACSFRPAAVTVYAVNSGGIALNLKGERL
jgi:hypothetical protein